LKTGKRHEKENFAKDPKQNLKPRITELARPIAI
jgi:hypothetical protein